MQVRLLLTLRIASFTLEGKQLCERPQAAVRMSGKDGNASSAVISGYDPLPHRIEFDIARRASARFLRVEKRKPAFCGVERESMHVAVVSAVLTYGVDSCQVCIQSQKRRIRDFCHGNRISCTGNLIETIHINSAAFSRRGICPDEQIKAFFGYRLLRIILFPGASNDQRTHQ